MSLHAQNRTRLLQRFHNLDVPKNAVILLQGGKSRTQYDTDREILFRQESFFQWAFGVKEPDCFGLLDITRDKSVLFIPRLPREYAVWMGEIKSPQTFQQLYEVDEVRYVDQIQHYLQEINCSVIFVLKGQNTDSGKCSKPATFKGIEQWRVDTETLFPEIVELRVFKTPEELNLLRYVNKISSDAHKTVMRAARPGMMEYELESIFLHEVYSKGGCRHVSYTCICCSGPNGAILHYGHAGAPNDRQLKDGDMCLFDMGAEYHCYSSDITCSWPANGKFTRDQRDIYETVLAAHNAVIREMKPGVKWPDMHRLAERTILEEMQKRGFLKGSVEEMTKVHLGAYFMPHGLGHFFGLDVHDVGGYPKGVERIDEPGIRKLRTTRTLQENMCITVEPGVYFVKDLLAELYNNAELRKFIVQEKLDNFWTFGGVRIESDVIVTATGAENITKVPRTVDEIEEWMSQRQPRDQEMFY
jgi:Xaa-Pro dipeptidase